MQSIAELVASQLPAMELMVRGKRVLTRALTMQERHLAVLAAGPMPAPPMAQPLHKGSNAPFEPNVHDVKYRAELNTWGDRVILRELVLSLSDPADQVDIKALSNDADRLEKVLTASEVALIRTTMEQLERSEAVASAAVEFDDGVKIEGGLANLIGPVPEPSLDGPQQGDIPEKYGVTTLYLHLRLVERFGWGIVEAMKRMTPQAIRTLEEYERLRQREEALMFQAAR